MKLQQIFILNFLPQNVHVKKHFKNSLIWKSVLNSGHNLIFLIPHQVYFVKSKVYSRLKFIIASHDLVDVLFWVESEGSDFSVDLLQLFLIIISHYKLIRIVKNLIHFEYWRSHLYIPRQTLLYEVFRVIGDYWFAGKRKS